MLGKKQLRVKGKKRENDMKGMMSIKFIRYGLSNMPERNFLHPKNAINNSQQQISIVLPFEEIESKKNTAEQENCSGLLF